VLAIVIALTNFTFVLFILPESLPESHRLPYEPSPVDPQPQLLQQHKGMAYRIRKYIRNVSSEFLRPATLFIPQKLEGRRGRDWNLTLTGAALFIYVLSDVSRIQRH
jgi:hypothetical protein